MRNLVRICFCFELPSCTAEQQKCVSLIKPASICLFLVMFPFGTGKWYFQTFCSKIFLLTSVFRVRVDAPVGVQHVSEEVGFVKVLQMLTQFIKQEIIISSKIFPKKLEHSSSGETAVYFLTFLINTWYQSQIGLVTQIQMDKWDCSNMPDKCSHCGPFQFLSWSWNKTLLLEQEI